MTHEGKQLTRVLERLSKGEPGAAEELLEAVSKDLRQLADSNLIRGGRTPTLEPTAIVHELWAKLASQSEPPTWESRGHFFKWASVVMRNVVRDYARKQNSQKAGGGRVDIALDLREFGVADPAADSDALILEIDDAFDVLHEVNPELAELARLRFYAGLSYEELASELDLSESQVGRKLAVARAWFKAQLLPDSVS